MKHDKLLQDKWELMIDRIETERNISIFDLKKEFGDQYVETPEFAFYLLKRTLYDWVDVDEEYYQVIANWIIGTYYIDYFVSYPYLFLNAVKRAGKTRLLKLISNLAFNGVYTSSLTEAVLFRMPTVKQCTLTLDEAESISLKQKSSLRMLLNSAYKKGMKIFRARKDKKTEKYVIDEFEIFMPIAIANIRGIDDVLEDRCITIILERSKRIDVITKPEYFELDKKFDIFRSIMRHLTSVGSVDFSIKNMYTDYTTLRDILLHYNTNNTTYTTYTNLEELILNLLKKDIIARDFECWFPLFIINHFFCPNGVKNMLETAGNAVKERKITDIVEDRDTSILIFVGNFIQDRQQDEFFSISKMTIKFKEIDGSDWLRPSVMSKILKRLKVVIEKRRLARGVEVRLDFEKIENKCKELGIVLNVMDEKQDTL